MRAAGEKPWSTWLGRIVLGAAVSAIFAGVGVVIGRSERVPLIEQRLGVIETNLGEISRKLDRLNQQER